VWRLPKHHVFLFWSLPEWAKQRQGQQCRVANVWWGAAHCHDLPGDTSLCISWVPKEQTIALCQTNVVPGMRHWLCLKHGIETVVSHTVGRVSLVFVQSALYVEVFRVSFLLRLESVGVWRWWSHLRLRDVKDISVVEGIRLVFRLVCESYDTGSCFPVLLIGTSDGRPNVTRRYPNFHVAYPEEQDPLFSVYEANFLPHYHVSSEPNRSWVLAFCISSSRHVVLSAGRVRRVIWLDNPCEAVKNQKNKKQISIFLKKN
jgi:hypothetical protein